MTEWVIPVWGIPAGEYTASRKDYVIIQAESVRCPATQPWRHRRKSQILSNVPDLFLSFHYLTFLVYF